MKPIARAVLLAALAVFCAAGVFGQAKDSLVILPFSGGVDGQGDYIVGALARQRELRAAFSNKVTPVNKTNQAFLRFEQKFQRDSGLTDADSILELGKQLGAAFVMAGYITDFAGRHLILISILDVESLQQIAGDYREYKEIEDIDPVIPDMARKLARLVQRDTSKLPGLSVPSFEVPKGSGIDEKAAQTLAQILACDLANGSAYAVLPRTDSIEKVRAEHERQRTGETDQERVKRLGVGKNAQYVLAGSVTKFGRLNKFIADVLDIKDFIQIDGYDENYTALTDGIALMPKLAAKLNGTSIIVDPNPPSANFIRIAGGTFTMGSPSSEVDRWNNEGPQHQVTISKPFYIGKYEVTQAEYEAVMGSNPSSFKGGNLPVESVSWYDAVEYCNKRSIKEGLTPAYTIDKTRSDANNTNGSDNVKWVVTWNKNANGYRLPTEAEWELACRAGTGTPFYTGNNITTNHANYDGNYPYNNNAKGEYRGKTWNVGSGTPNPWGLYDMSGNVWEWCWDWYGSYSGGSQTDPTGASSGSSRVCRGGGWNFNARGVRAAYRSGNNPANRGSNLGFRVLRP